MTSKVLQGHIKPLLCQNLFSTSFMYWFWWKFWSFVIFFTLKPSHLIKTLNIWSQISPISCVCNKIIFLIQGYLFSHRVECRKSIVISIHLCTGCPKKKPFKDFWERLDDIFQNCFWILKLVVYPHHLKKQFSQNCLSEKAPGSKKFLIFLKLF